MKNLERTKNFPLEAHRYHLNESQTINSLFQRSISWTANKNTKFWSFFAQYVIRGYLGEIKIKRKKYLTCKNFNCVF